MSAATARGWWVAALLLAAVVQAPAGVAAAPADEVRALDPLMAAELERVATACTVPEGIANCQDAIRAWFGTHDPRAANWQIDRLVEELRFDIEVAALLARMEHADAPAAVERFRERHQALLSAQREATGQREPAALAGPPADSSNR
ncbi:hypothetical protein [Azospirillum sp. sgz301742]